MTEMHPNDSGRLNLAVIAGSIFTPLTLILKNKLDLRVRDEQPNANQSGNDKILLSLRAIIDNSLNLAIPWSFDNPALLTTLLAAKIYLINRAMMLNLK